LAIVIRGVEMASHNQKVLEKSKEVQKRLAAVDAARGIRRKIAQAHGTFPEINSLIRETREGSAS
jgi:ribosomal protein L18E